MWNEEYSRKFITNATDLATCDTIRIEDEKKIKADAKCNQWGPWTKTTDCPLCGSGRYTEQRKCYNFDKSSNVYYCI